MSGEQTSEKEIIRLGLKVVVNNTIKPVHIINFLLDDSLDPMTNKPFGIKKDKPQYKEAANKINHWHSLISVLIRQADESDERESLEKYNYSPSNSMADELKKLSDLLKEGILTENEYKELKEALIQKNK
ncbi:MAG: hypothetical protein ACQEXX_06170 [Bacillota bacterium]